MLFERTPLSPSLELKKKGEANRARAGRRESRARGRETSQPSRETICADLELAPVTKRRRQLGASRR